MATKQKRKERRERKRLEQEQFAAALVAAFGPCAMAGGGAISPLYTPDGKWWFIEAKMP